ncbi:MAG: glycosyltransferase [Acidobacteria bacterium]|nr:glycosyltransferase [Acidobacteriota bacterium]
MESVTMCSERVRLLEFMTVFAVGGTERHCVNLLGRLDQSLFEIHLACLKRDGDFLSEIDTRRIPLSEYRTNKLYNYNALRAQIRFASYLKTHRIQIVHTYGFYANVFAIPAARMAGVPVIVASIRDTGAHLTPLQMKVQRWVCRWADCVLANAEAIRKWLLVEGYCSGKIQVIPNGIDVSGFANQRGGRLRQELGLPPQAPVVAVIARLIPVKGIDYFLEAAAAVAQRVQEARFLIVGDGPCKTDLERLAARLGLNGRAVFAGRRLDVPALLSEITVSVLPSISEGLPNVLLESMAAAVPVIATDVGGNAEVVEDGVTGLLVPPRDPQALARAICRLLRDPQMLSRFGERGKRRASVCFHLETRVRETERLYLNLLEKRRNARFDFVRAG